MTEPIRLDGHEPGSPEWLKCMSASKVAAVLGLSPWESRYSLWHRMGGLVPPQGTSDEKQRGHYLEPAIRNWFMDQHPELTVGSVGATFAHPERTWQIASPDGVLWDLGGYADQSAPTALLECKTSGNSDEWGYQDTDEVPVYYRAQGIWQMDVMGVDKCYVAVLTDRLQFRQYLVEYDESEADYIRQECMAFVNSLPGGIAEEVPDVDAHGQTYEVLRKLPAGLVDESIEISAALAIRYHAAVSAYKAAESEQRESASLVLAAIGDYHWADVDGQRVATRVALKKDGSTSYLKPAKNFAPDIPLEQ